MMCKWSVKGAERMSLPGAQNRRQHLDGRLIYDEPVKKWLDQFLDIWIGDADNLAENRPAPVISLEHKKSA